MFNGPASDKQHTVLDTIVVRVDPRNYPPAIERIRDREVKEGEELVLPLVVKDKNGDENLVVSVVESDVQGYRFDAQERKFYWKPDFSFVKDSPRRSVFVKFRVTDRESEDLQTAKIIVVDRDGLLDLALRLRIELKCCGSFVHHFLLFCGRSDRNRTCDAGVTPSGFRVRLLRPLGHGATKVARDRSRTCIIPSPSGEPREEVRKGTRHSQERALRHPRRAGLAGPCLGSSHLHGPLGVPCVPFPSPG